MITITNNNIYYSEFSISTLSNMNKVEIVDMNDIIQFLTERVELGESVTFKRLFDIISYNVQKFNEIFFTALGGYSLEPYLQEIENNKTEEYESDFLEIHWFCDKYQNELTISPSLHGISIKDNETYAMDFVSLNNLKDYNIKINERVEYFDYNFEESDLKENKICLGDKKFTLFELYDAIFTEITFHGGPQDKIERLDELKESINEIKENYEKSEGLIAFEDILAEYELNDIYLVKYKDLRDRVEEDRIKNSNLPQLKKCIEEKLKIYDLIQNSEENLNQYYKKLTDIEYNMQLLYGEKEDISYHKFWETPKCTCPKIDNIEIYPSSNPIFNPDCLIHKNK